MTMDDYRVLVRQLMDMIGSDDWHALPDPQRGRLTGRVERLLTLAWNRAHPKSKPQHETHMETREASA